MRIVPGILSVLVATGCSPESGGRVSPEPPAYLAGTDSHIVTSSITGRTYQVSVALPRGYHDSTKLYPVLYALDANGEFGIVVESARLLQAEGLVPELVVVGIGYPVGHYLDAITERAVDLTVTEDPRFEERWRALGSPFPVPERSGGGPLFLRFLVDELIPRVDADYRVDPRDRALFGHSFGGLFAFHALLESGRAFQRFVVSSPTLAWHDGVSFEHESAYAAEHDSLRARAFFSVGLLEADAPPEEAPWAGYITNLRRLDSIFQRRSYAGFDWSVHYFDDETHLSVLGIAISRGLRYVYGTN